MKEYKRLTNDELNDFIQRVVVQLNPTLTQQVMSIVLELEEYRTKIENKTLVELPIAIGQTIYRKDAHFCWEITEATVYEDEIIFYDDSENMIKVEDIGKKVFLTKAEAEAKLKELQNE